MTDLELALYNILTTHGVPVLIIACLTIFAIGILKYFNVFSKISKGARKPIYLVLNYIFTFGFTAAYYYLFKINFDGFLTYALMVGSAVNIIYPLYENLKIRDLLGVIGNAFIKLVASKQLAAEKEKLDKPEKTIEPTT